MSTLPEDAGAATADAAQTHLVLIPSYNTGLRLCETVMEALVHWPCVWVVIDGSTDGSDTALAACIAAPSGLRILYRQRNGGKGAAVLHGLREAARCGFTHVLVMDADGQHPAGLIAEFMEISRQNPDAMILGAPRFDASAPRLRVLWRKVSNFLTRLETQRDLADSLFGFRVYPLSELLEIMEARPGMRGFDFDTEALVRLSWRGVRAINRPAPVRYFRADDGGVSHFRYLRDNLLLAAMHLRLLAGKIRLRPESGRFLKTAAEKLF